MSFVSHKTICGKKYAYEITSYWDSKTKQVKKRNKYLGVLGAAGEIYKNRDRKPSVLTQERLQLDFGDGFLLKEFTKQSMLHNIISEVFSADHKELLPLVFYRLSMQSAMYNASEWLSGNITQLYYSGSNLSSQNISKTLKYLGNESIQRQFFLKYIAVAGGSNKAVIIDATSLPNQCNVGFNAWGYSDGHIEKQFRLLCVLDQDTKRPLFYRYLPGNMPDVSTLEQTVAELGKMGIKTKFSLIDAGYFSEDNVNILYENKIDFLTRLPSSRVIYQELILTQTADLENTQYATKCNTRGLFVKRVKHKAYGKDVYVFIVLDPVRKGKESERYLLEYLEKNESNKEESFAGCGIMMLISSLELDPKTVVSDYYARQAVEQVFGFCKDDLQLLPLRCHSDETMRGYLFLQFIALILFLELHKALQNKYTVEQAMLITRNLKCKVFQRELLVAELTKKQKEVFELCKIMVPKSCGI